ncbi:MAG TPA: ATP-binding protein [Candidatus Acidoferrales bacterium]|nr:ATP-binding protein [Candidatus Acidoferrales bacterium]
MLRHRLLHAISAAVMLAGLVAAVLLCNNIIRRESAELQRTSEAEARRIAAHFQAGMLASLEPLEQLGRWWLSQGKPEAREDWRTDGQLFLSKALGLRQALWVGADGFEHWVATPGADPKISRSRPNDRIRRVIAAANARRSITISDIFDLPTASSVLYVCFPIDENRRVKGYVLGLYDANALVAPLVRSGVRPDYHITVSVAGRRIYSTSPALRTTLAPRGVSATFELAQLYGSVELRVPLNYLREFRGSILTFAAVVGALIYSFSTLLYISQRYSLTLYKTNLEVRDLNRDLNRKIVDFQTLLDVSPIGIAVTNDLHCRSIRANRALAKILGVPQDANISKSIPQTSGSSWRMIREGRELRPEELPMQVAAASGKEQLGEEYRIVRADGSEIDILSFAAPLVDEQGMVRGAIQACVDISERKAQEQVQHQLEQDLQRARRIKSLGEMAAGIAHDFNNLLTGIIGQASLAAEQLSPDSGAYEHVAASLRSAQQAAKLIGQVLAYTGQMYPRLRPTDIGQVLADAHSKLTALAARKARIRLAIDPQLPQVMADPDEVRQVLHNLVLNAVEATVGGDNTIEIRVDMYQASGTERNLGLPGEPFAPGAYLRLTVNDKGSGMPAEIAERAFDPFFSTKFLGRGLGLAEVLGIMRAHHGGVHLETTPEQGTSVTVLFPASQHSATRAA